MEDCLQLLHFHLGSQITNIRQIKAAVIEAARVYVDLARARRGTAVTWTSAAAWASTTTARRPTSNRASITRCRNTPTTSSITSRTCATKPSVPHPTIVTESGRAIAAYHSVLVFNVLGVSGFGEEEVPPEVSGGSRAAADRSAGDLPVADHARICWRASTTRSRRSIRR